MHTLNAATLKFFHIKELNDKMSNLVLFMACFIIIYSVILAWANDAKLGFLLSQL